MTKKIIIGAFLTLYALVSMSQKPSTEAIKHNYYQTPRYVLSKDKIVIKEVVLTYLENNQRILEDIENLNKSREERAEKERENYENKKTSSKVAERILLGKKKPAQAEYIAPPFLQKEWSEADIKNGCKTSGIQEHEDAQAKIVMTVLSFDHSKENKTDAPKGIYSYYVSGKAGIKVDGINEEGEVLVSKSFMSRCGKAASNFSSNSAREIDFQKNTLAFTQQIEQKCMQRDLAGLQKFVTDNLDYNTVEHKSKIYIISDKKGTYSDINGCLSNFSRGLQYLSIAETYGKGIEIIKQVIPIYENELKGYVPSDKKARINKPIAQALYINLAQAYIWTNNFKRANNALIEAKIINPKKHKKTLELLKVFLDDQEMRFNASH